MADLRSTLHPLRTVRGRAALFVGVTTFVALVLAAALILFLFGRSIEAALDQTLLTQAGDRAQLLDEGSDPSSLVELRQEESFVWIGTAAGDMVAQGGPITPLENPVPDELEGVSEVILLAEELHLGEELHADEAEFERMDLRIAAATTSDGSLVVLAGTETEVVDNTVGELRWLFMVIVPLIVAAVAGFAWISTGRALSPVEKIRRRTEEVSGTSLSERVPVPDTGDEVQQLALTMNEMLERLEHHQLALRQFTADASHELKSPVANLRALVETAEIDGEEWTSLESRLTKESDRLKDLVENLLFLASHGENDATGVRGVVHVDDLLFDEAEAVSAIGDVAVDIGGIGPAELHGNSSDLRRLTRNLADNAVRHASSRVVLACRSTDGVVQIVVEDDGPGIPSQDRSRVFERFARLDESRHRDDGGTGLGLAIVKQIVDDHEGTITIGDGALGGALVVVTLPGAC